MTTIPLTQSIDHASLGDSPEARAEAIKKEIAAIEFDYATHFGSAELAKEAKKINDCSIRYLRRNLEWLIKQGKRIKTFRDLCCERSGATQGMKDFNYWLASEGEPGHVTRAAVEIYEWYETLSCFWQRFVNRYVKSWSFSCLKLLSELNTEILHLFFWAADLLKNQRKRRKRKETSKELKEIVRACQGIRKVVRGQALEITDWVYIFAVTGVERDSFETVREAARAIASGQERDEVWLEDAIATLKELGFETRELEKSSQSEKPTSKTFTLAEVEQIQAEHLQQLQQKEQALFQLQQENVQLKEHSQQETSKRVVAEERARVAEEHARVAEEHSRQLEQENLALRSQLRTQDSPETTVDVTPIVEEAHQSDPKEPQAQSVVKSSQTDVFDEYLPLWGQESFQIGSCIRVVDKNNKDYNGRSGKITGRDRNGWWIELTFQGDKLFKQFTSQQLELVPQLEKTSDPKVSFERVSQKFKEVKRSLFQPSISPAAL